MVLPLASTMQGQKVFDVHMLSKGNFQPLFPRRMQEKLHLQPWKWPWKKHRPSYALWRDSSEAWIINTLILLWWQWGISCQGSSPEQNYVFSEQNQTHIGFKLKSKGMVIILPQHHLPNAALGLHRGWCSILNFFIWFSFSQMRYTNDNVKTTVCLDTMLLLYSLNKKLFPFYTSTVLPWSCYSKSSKLIFMYASQCT